MPPRGVKKGTKRARQRRRVPHALAHRDEGHLVWPPRRSALGPRGRTRDQLYEEARDLNIEGRSKMDKRQPQRAVDAKKR